MWLDRPDSSLTYSSGDLRIEWEFAEPIFSKRVAGNRHLTINSQSFTRYVPELFTFKRFIYR